MEAVLAAIKANITPITEWLTGTLLPQVDSIQNMLSDILHKVDTIIQVLDVKKLEERTNSLERQLEQQNEKINYQIERLQHDLEHGDSYYNQLNA